MCIEEKTCAPLSGAFLTVFRDGQEIGAASSDETGAALFSPICPGSYLLKASHAAGWQANERAYTLLIAPNGRESVDGISIAYAKICFAKQKETKQ
jgi:hypothetical protein